MINGSATVLGLQLNQNHPWETWSKMPVSDILKSITDVCKLKGSLQSAKLEWEKDMEGRKWRCGKLAILWKGKTTRGMEGLLGLCQWSVPTLSWVCFPASSWSSSQLPGPPAQRSNTFFWHPCECVHTHVCAHTHNQNLTFLKIILISC